jgi:hypothetical protein
MYSEGKSSSAVPGKEPRVWPVGYAVRGCRASNHRQSSFFAFFAPAIDVSVFLILNFVFLVFVPNLVSLTSGPTHFFGSSTLLVRCARGPFGDFPQLLCVADGDRITDAN